MIIDKFLFDYNTQHIEMPRSSKILKAVAWGPGKFALWALVDPNAPSRKRAIKLYSTGQEIDNELALTGHYVDTIEDGPYILHVFDHGEMTEIKK